MWRQFPPEAVPPEGEVLFGSGRRTEGYVVFTMPGVSEPFKLQWDVPFWGEPSSDATYPDKYRVGKEEIFQFKDATIEFSVHDPYEGDYRYGDKDVKLVVETPVVYETWKYLLKKALQGILITLSNTTNYNLHLLSCETTHGVWSLSPPQSLPSGAEIDCGAESHGLTGEMIYYVEKEDKDDHSLQIKFSWDVPVIGSPGYSSNVFTVIPKLLGAQSEVVLRFSMDETFLVELQGDKKATPNTETETKIPIHQKTAYGFESPK